MAENLRAFGLFVFICLTDYSAEKLCRSHNIIIIEKKSRSRRRRRRLCVPP